MKETTKATVSVVGSILLDLLDDIGKATEVITYRAKSYEHVLRIRAGRERKSRYQAIQQLKRRKLIEIRKTATGLSIALTAKGRAKAVREQLRVNKALLPKGQSCMVVFDIPERAKLSRQTFRRFLKDSGFQMIQLSVWETRRDAFDLVKEFIHHAQIRQWVTVVQTTRKA